MRAKFESSGIDLQTLQQEAQSKAQAEKSPKRSFSPYMPGSLQRSQSNVLYPSIQSPQPLYPQKTDFGQSSERRKIENNLHDLTQLKQQLIMFDEQRQQRYASDNPEQSYDVAKLQLINKELASQTEQHKKIAIQRGISLTAMEQDLQDQKLQFEKLQKVIEDQDKRL